MNTFIKKPKWLTITVQDINLYKQRVSMYLSELVLLENILSCRDFGCEKVEHMKIIDFLYDSIIRICSTASKDLINIYSAHR